MNVIFLGGCVDVFGLLVNALVFLKVKAGRFSVPALRLDLLAHEPTRGAGSAFNADTLTKTGVRVSSLASRK